MRGLLKFALRGAVGFGLGGLIMMLGMAAQVKSVPDNLSYMPREKDESALVGQWTGRAVSIDSATFREDGTFTLRPADGRHVIEGTYAMTDKWVARLDNAAPWTRAYVTADPEYPNNPYLHLTHDDGTVIQLEWFRKSAPVRYRPSPFSVYGSILVLPFLCGAVGAIVLTLGTGSCTRGTLGFGCASIPAMLIVLFTHISLQGGGTPEYMWGAVGSGFGFALAGAIGGLAIRPGLLLPGAISFGLAGAVWGPISFWSVVSTYTTGSTAVDRILGVLITLFPFVVGGGLFGAAVGLVGVEE